MYKLKDKQRNYNRLHYTVDDMKRYEYSLNTQPDGIIKGLLFIIFMDTAIDYGHININHGGRESTLKLTITI